MATPTHHTQQGAWTMNAPSGYWRISGLVLAVVAALGILLNLAVGSSAYLISAEFLRFDMTHNVIHVVLAAVALGFGFGPVKKATAAKAAVIVGVVYLVLGVSGVLSASLFGIGEALGLHLEIGENIIHLALGAWGILAGRT